MMKFAKTKEKPKTELCEYFVKYGSDKCPQIFHTYSPIYYEILKDYKLNFKNVLEIGVGSNKIMNPIVGDTYVIGASLRAWRDFFVNSNVYGLDYDKNVLFNDIRINCYFTNQSSEYELETTIKKIREDNGDDIYFDLIIDDGSHIIEHMILSIKTLNKYLKTGGYYIIEDIKKKDIENFKSININGLEIVKIHPGVSEWDGFIAYKKI